MMATRNNVISEISALITQIEITAATTRWYVTSSWYLRLRRIAKNLSAQRAVTLNNVAKMKRFVAKIKSFVGIRRVSLFRFEFIACATTIGWTSKPTPDQKQLGSRATFLNFWTETKSFWSRRLLQCSAWWRCKTSTRLIRKAWDMTNPFDDLFGSCGAWSKQFLVGPCRRLLFFFFRMIRPNPRHGLTNAQRVPKRLVS